MNASIYKAGLDDHCDGEDFSHVQMEEIFSILSDNIREIEHLYFESNAETERNPNSVECIDLLSTVLQFSHPDLISELLNDEFIYNLLISSITPEEKYSSLKLYYLMCKSNLIENTKDFIELFQTVFYQTTAIQTEIDIKIFHLIKLNLIFSYNAGEDVFDQDFFQHLSHFSHSSIEFDISTLDFMYELMTFIEINKNNVNPNPEILRFYCNFLSGLDISNDEIGKVVLEFCSKLQICETFSIIWENDNIEQILLALWAEVVKSDDKFCEIGPRFTEICSRSNKLIRQMHFNSLMKITELNKLESWSGPMQNFVDVLSSILKFTVAKLISYFDDELRVSQLDLIQFCYRAMEIASFEVKSNLCIIVSLIFQNLPAFFGDQYGQVVMDNLQIIADLFAFYFPTATELTYLLLCTLKCFLDQLSKTEFKEIFFENFDFGPILDELHTLIDEMDDDSQYYDDIREMVQELDETTGFNCPEEP